MVVWAVWAVWTIVKPAVSPNFWQNSVDIETLHFSSELTQRWFASFGTSKTNKACLSSLSFSGSLQRLCRSIRQTPAGHERTFFSFMLRQKGKEGRLLNSGAEEVPRTARGVRLRCMTSGRSSLAAFSPKFVTADTWINGSLGRNRLNVSSFRPFFLSFFLSLCLVTFS